jgi:hypothetical protein
MFGGLATDLTRADFIDIRDLVSRWASMKASRSSIPTEFFREPYDPILNNFELIAPTAVLSF